MYYYLYCTESIYKINKISSLSQVLPSLPSSKRSQVESLQRKIAETEGSPSRRTHPADSKDAEVQVGQLECAALK